MLKQQNIVHITSAFFLFSLYSRVSQKTSTFSDFAVTWPKFAFVVKKIPVLKYFEIQGRLTPRKWILNFPFKMTGIVAKNCPKVHILKNN